MKRSIRKVSAALSTVITMLYFGLGTVMAYAASAAGSGAMDKITQWGDNILADISKIARYIAYGFVIILGIIVVTAGRGWAEKLKSGLGALVVGIILITFGVSIVTGLMA